MPFWQSLQSLYDELFFRLFNLTWLEALDLLLVTVTFFFLLNLVQRSQVSLLLRGQLVLVVLLFVTTILLPLPTFDWLILGLLFAVLVATPVIFQPELRRFFERIGRNAGITWAVRQTATENMIPKLVRAVENMSASHTGALVALEGKRILREVIETGVVIEGQVSSELLQAIFFPENPLHDGAIVLREDRLVAASCVLPLTQRPLPSRRRLGTRHRAAVGLSEHSDALVIVVSEETGTISVARDGELRRPLDSAVLREQLYEFYVPAPPPWPTPSLTKLIRQAGRWLWQQLLRFLLWWRHPRRIPSNFFSQLGLLFVSLLLALIAWTFVIERTNPARRELFEGISLRVEDIPPGLTLTEPPPTDVSALIQTTDSVLPNLRPSSFQAIASLDELPSGLHSVPIQVNAGVPRVRVLTVEPATLDVDLEPIITQTMKVNVTIPDQDNLSPAYQIVSPPLASPDQVQVIGAAPLVEQVSQVQAELALGNANTSIKRLVPVQALDEAGRPITGVNLQPAQVEVSLPIQRQTNARNVGVRPVTSGLPPEGYRLSSLSVSPTNITLQGNPSELAQMGSYVDTLPVDLSQAIGDLNTQVPLALSPNIQALDSNGNPIRTVTVQIQIVPRSSYLVTTRPVELLGITPDITATIDPPTIELIMNGPAPILSQIEKEPDLVKVVADVVGIDPPQTVTRQLTVVAPDEISMQIIPDAVQVTLLP
jgi:diadenylate cyclase